MMKESEVDQLNLFTLFKLLFSYKWIILASGIMFSFVSFLYVRVLPDIYVSDMLLVPSGQSQSTNGLNKLGGLAGLAGISLESGERNKTTTAIQVLKSRQFFRRFADKYKILPKLVAVDRWDIDTGQLKFMGDIYDEKNDRWLIYGKNGAFNDYQAAHRSFLKSLDVQFDEDTGIYTISFSHKSPIFAKFILERLVAEINFVTKQDDIQQAENSINYLTMQAQKNSFKDIQNGLYELIQQQLQTIMLAESRPDYLFMTVDPPYIPSLPSSPKRPLVIVFCFLLGVFLACTVVLILFFTSEMGNNNQVQSGRKKAIPSVQ